MSRPLRILYPGAVYHVMNRGAARQAIFAHATEYELFLQVLADCHARWRRGQICCCEFRMGKQAAGKVCTTQVEQVEADIRQQQIWPRSPTMPTATSFDPRMR